MTQQQPYEPIGRWGDVEIRRYPEHTIAEIVVDGDFDDALELIIEVPHFPHQVCAREP